MHMFLSWQTELSEEKNPGLHFCGLSLKANYFLDFFWAFNNLSEGQRKPNGKIKTGSVIRG
jgi:hypothetical protein